MMINILISYAYIRQSRIFLERASAMRPHVRFLLDSGAFTAHTQGRPIDLDEYCAFIKATKHLWWKYIALDKIGDSATTAQNLKIMRRNGLNPMPVLTVDASVNGVCELLADSDAMCVAGGVTEPIERYGPRLAEVRSRVGDGVLLHGLGFTRGLKVARTEANAVDSSSWISAQRYGTFYWYDPSRGPVHRRWQQLRATPWTELPEPVRKAIVALGVTKADITADIAHRGRFSITAAQTVMAWVAYAAELKRRKGTMLFFASNPSDVPAMLIPMACGTKNGVSWSACSADVGAFRDRSLDYASLAQRASAQMKKEWDIE